MTEAKIGNTIAITIKGNNLPFGTNQYDVFERIACGKEIRVKTRNGEVRKIRIPYLDHPICSVTARSGKEALNRLGN